MALRKWIGRAAPVSQVNEIALVGASTAVVFTITINGRGVSYRCVGGDTNTLAAAALAATLNTSAIPEFDEINWTSAGNIVTATGPSDGKPFTQTSSASSGSATTTMVRSPSGPNYWNVAINWSDNTLPDNDDDVVIDAGPAILYGINQSALELSSLSIVGNYRAEIGLAAYTPTGYPEYRTTHLTLGSGNVLIDAAIRRGRFNFGTSAVVISIVRGDDLGFLAVNSANVLRMGAGRAEIAPLNGEDSQFATIVLAGGALRLGPGLSLANLEQTNGTLTSEASITTVVKSAGEFLRLAGAIATFRNRGGPVNDSASEFITNVFNGAEWRRSGPNPVTYANTTVYRSSTTTDADGTITFTNPVQFFECHPANSASSPGQAPAYFNPGIHRKFAVSDI